MKDVLIYLIISTIITYGQHEWARIAYIWKHL